VALHLLESAVECAGRGGKVIRTGSRIRIGSRVWPLVACAGPGPRSSLALGNLVEQGIESVSAGVGPRLLPEIIVTMGVGKKVVRAHRGVPSGGGSKSRSRL
jgi:hypothetical protein